MGDMIIIAVLALILSFAVFYVVREKKKGTKCIGCPHAKACMGSCAKGFMHKAKK